MRPSEAKSDFAYDPLKDEWCIIWPSEWTFRQPRFAPCQVSLTMDFTGRPKAIEQMSQFARRCKAYGDRIEKLWLKTVALTLSTYELTECSDIDIEPVDLESYKISFQCLYYDQYVKVNKDVKYETFKPFELG